MGNCQTVDAATMVLQHPNGRVEKWYWPLLAKEAMKANPGHYVALIITLTNNVSQEETKTKMAMKTKKELENSTRGDGVRITRVKLLRPNDTLVLGQAYRLISSQEVMKGMWAKKYAKMKKKELEFFNEKPKVNEVCENQSLRCGREERSSEMNQVLKQERHQRKTSNYVIAARSRAWRPSLQSISESSS